MRSSTTSPPRSTLPDEFTLRRLDPVADRDLLLTAFRWDTTDTPEWFRRAEAVWSEDTPEAYLARAARPEQADIAIEKNGQTAGIITLEMIAPGVIEMFFSAPRGSDSALLTAACWQVGSQLLRDGVAAKLVSWVCTLNRGALRLNRACGMQDTGVALLKGAVRGRVLEWKRLELTRRRWEELTIGEEDQNSDTAAAEFSEHLRDDQSAGQRVHAVAR